MNEKACFIFSQENAIIDDELKHKLNLLLNKLVVDNGVTMFYFNDSKIYDYFCLSQICELQIYYPNVKAVLIENKYNFKMPHLHNPNENIDRDFYEIIYEKDFLADNILRKNFFLVNKCKYIVFYSIPFGASGIDETYKYATDKKRTVFILSHGRERKIKEPPTEPSEYEEPRN